MNSRTLSTGTLSPFYRNRAAFDRMANLLASTVSGDGYRTGYPAIDIEKVDEDQFSITLAVPGFERDELSIESHKGQLTVRGEKQNSEQNRNFLHRGIAVANFERQFQLGEHIEVVNANVRNGLLQISLKEEVPEAMKPRSIPISYSDTDQDNSTLEHDTGNEAA